MDSNISSAADMFSLGLLMLALYNSPHTSPIKTNSNMSTYKKLFSSSSSAPSASNNFLSSRPLPKDLLSAVLPRLITRRAGQRMNAREFQQSQFFDNILVSSIRFLDSLPAKTPNEKSQFMRGLSNILAQFPKAVLDKKVLPALLDEMKDKDLLALVLQNVFKIVKLLPSGRRAFVEKVIPKLRETFPATGGKNTITERDSAKEAGLVVILENMELIGENCSGREFKDDVFPILQLGLESHTHAIVDKSLGCLATVLAVLDFSTIKNEVFPVVASVFSKTSSLGIKIRGLQAFVVLCGGSSEDSVALGDGLDGAAQKSRKNPSNSAVLDKYTVQEKVVPLLKAMKTKEPAVMMAALAVFKQVGQIADTDFLAMECLPILWSFSLGPLLNLQQFQEYMDLIKKLSSRIEKEQIRKLNELSSSSANADPSDLMNVGSTDNIFGTNGVGDVGENDFERLVLGRSNHKNSKDMLGDALRPQSQRSQSSQGPTPAFSWSTPAPQQVSNATIQPSSSSTFSRVQNHSIQSSTPSSSSLGNFAALKPTPPPSAGISNGISSFTPLQPSPKWTPPPSNPSTHFHITPPSQNSNPSNPLSSFPTFSLPPPPPSSTTSQNQRQYGAGLARPPNGNVVAGTTTSNGHVPQAQAQRKGLDAYESLL